MTLSSPAAKPQRQTLKVIQPARRHRRVFVKGLTLEASIGIHQHELNAPQPIIIDIDLNTADVPPKDDNIDEVLCYEQVVNKVRAIVEQGHVNLVETLAEHLAATILQDDRVVSVRLRIEKPVAIEAAAGVGVEIERVQGDY